MDNKTEMIKKIDQELNTLADEVDFLHQPEFEKVFEELYKIDEKQKLIYNTVWWNFSDNIPESIDLKLINKALKKAGYGDNKDLCDSFIKYARLILRGKELMQQRACLTIDSSKYQSEPYYEIKGWRFITFQVCAPPGMHKSIFLEYLKLSSQPNIHKESINPVLDDYANAKPFQIDTDLTAYIDILKQYKIIHEKDCLLIDKIADSLLMCLSRAVFLINRLSNKPNKIKHELADLLEKFGKFPVWGLFTQILFLEGLYEIFEKTDIKENDPGFAAFYSVYIWISNQLIDREVAFCTIPLSPNDQKRIEPLCEFLIDTSIGKFVQEDIFKHKERIFIDLKPSAMSYYTSNDENRYFRVIRGALAATNWENQSDGRFVDIDEVGVYRFIPSTIGNWWDLKDYSVMKEEHYDEIKKLPVIASGLLPQYIRWEQEKDVKQIFKEYYDNCYAVFKTRARNNIKLMVKSDSEIEAAYIETLIKEESNRIKSSFAGLSPFLPKDEQNTLKVVGDCFIEYLNDKLHTLNPPAKIKTYDLPEDLNSEHVICCFQKAIDANYIKVIDSSHFLWLGDNGKKAKARLAYFCGLIFGYNPSPYVNSDDQVPYSALETLFGVTRLDRALAQVYEAKYTQTWREIYDKLLQ